MVNRPLLTANSRRALKAWLTGMDGANGVAMMFGVHGGEEIGRGFVFGLLLPAAPMHEKAVAKAPQHSGDAQGLRLAHATEIIQMGNVQAQVQPGFNSPGGAVVFEPVGGVEFCWGKTGDQSYRFGPVVPQVAAQQGDLCDAREVHLLGGGADAAQGAGLELAFVKLTTARQVRRGVLREKNNSAELPRVSGCWLGRWADCL